MHVTLVFPRMDGPRATTVSLASSECLGLGYLAAALRRAGHVVTIINAELENLSVAETLARCLAADLDVLGCSPVSLSINPCLDMIEQVKAARPNTLIVLGGHLASLAAKEILEGERSVDLVLRGDAEETFCRLLAASSRTEYAHIPGAVWRDAEGRIHESVATVVPSVLASPTVIVPVATAGRIHPPQYRATNRSRRKPWQPPARNAPPLSALIFPDRDDLKRIVVLQGHVRGARMLASRGCKFHCSFCTTPQFYGRSVRYREPVDIVLEMNHLAEEFGVSHIWFNDDLFIDGSAENARWASDLAQRLTANKLRFSFRILCRADSFSDKNEDLLVALTRAGLTHVFLGLESGSQHSLEVYNKGFTLLRAKEAVKRIRAAELQPQIGFIMYNPYTRLDDLRENLAFLHEIGELFRIFPLTRPLSVFPGTPIAERLEADGLMKACSYREPIAGYQYQDWRIKVLATEMYRAHSDFAAIDNSLHKAFRGIDHGSSPVPSSEEQTVSDLNALRYASVLDATAQLKHDDGAQLRSMICSWMDELKSVSQQLGVIPVRL